MNHNPNEIVQLHLWTKRQIDELKEKVSTLQDKLEKQLRVSNQETAGEGEEL